MTDESTLDVSDLARHMGVPIMPGELKEPVTVGDIRRWVQAMHYPNPLHYDERWAAESQMVPTGSLPTALRRSGVSRP